MLIVQNDFFRIITHVFILTSYAFPHTDLENIGFDTWKLPPSIDFWFTLKTSPRRQVLLIFYIADKK